MSNVNVVEFGKVVDGLNLISSRIFTDARQIFFDVFRQFFDHVEAEERHRFRQRFAVRNFDAANVQDRVGVCVQLLRHQ